MDFQIIKINRIYEIILIEARFVVTLKFLDGKSSQIGLLKSNS